MKKLIVLVCAVVFLFGVIGFAQAQSKWAKYKENPIPSDVNVPQNHIYCINENEDPCDEGEDDCYCYLNCCGCHGQHPGLPELFCNKDNNK